MQMNRSDLWKNFRLGEELDVSGTFIYNGLRRFHELRKLDYSADLFEVFYQLSVGIERLMKIATVLLEHDNAKDQDAFEKSLSTHNHQALLAKVQKYVDLKLSNSDNAFLQLDARHQVHHALDCHVGHPVVRFVGQISLQYPGIYSGDQRARKNACTVSHSAASPRSLRVARDFSGSFGCVAEPRAPCAQIVRPQPGGNPG